ncbi:MAG: glycosyltransferase family 2 protein [Bacteroidota bacterium]
MKPNLLSIIVIGRNEGDKLRKCFDSIFLAISQNQLDGAEVLYVDSSSTDQSVELARSYQSVKVFRISSGFNAAVARNIGALESKGDFLFFVDGDMAIVSDFLALVIDKSDELKYDFVTGHVSYQMIDKNGEIVESSQFARNQSTNDRYEVTTGGVFLIRRQLWQSVDGMKSKYRRSQDLDLALRLARQGTKLLRKKETIAHHCSVLTTHVFEYRDSKRMWKMLFEGSFLYQTSVLYRDHVLNPHIFLLVLRNDYSLLVLLISLTLLMFSCPHSYFFVACYLLLITARGVFTGQRNILFSFERTVFCLFKDVSSILGLMFFHPRPPEFFYERVV